MKRTTRRSLVLSVVVVCVGAAAAYAAANYSGRIVHAIETTGKKQLQAGANRYGLGRVTKVTATCIQEGSSESYTCLAYYTVHAVRYRLFINASCSNSGECIWHADGNGEPTNGSRLAFVREAARAAATPRE
jgi:hypothetical protein